jgi:hypothetical protein
VIADEAAFWHTDEFSSNADTEILNAVRPGLATTRGVTTALRSAKSILVRFQEDAENRRASTQWVGLMLTKATMLLWFACMLTEASAADLPAIRSGPGNEVPKCVRAAELMAFVNERNRDLVAPRKFESRFSDIASVYQRIGPCVQRFQQTCEGIRWDFAFFQMLIETNYLTFRKPDGSPGGYRQRTIILLA